MNISTKKNDFARVSTILTVLLVVALCPQEVSAARLFSSGCEFQGDGSNNINITDELEWDIGLASPSMVIHNGANKRTGLSSCASIHSSAGKSSIVQEFRRPANRNPVFVRFYMRIGSLPSHNASVAALDADYILYLTPAGVLKLYDADGEEHVTGNQTLAINTWYRVEFSFGAGETVDVRVDGSPIFSTFTPEDGKSIGILNLGLCFTTTADLCNSGGNVTGTVYFDDIAINDSTGTFQNSWPGDGSIVHMQPNAAGATNNCFAGADYTYVDEITPDDNTTTCAFVTANHKLEVNLESASTAGIPGGANISVVHVGARHRKSNVVAGADMKYHLILKQGATSQNGTIITHDDTTLRTNGDAIPRNYTLTAYRDPATNAAWTLPGLDSLQIGMLATDVDPPSVVSTLWALVDYTTVVPPSAPTVTITANPASVYDGESTVLSWSTTNATSCTASGGWSGTKPTASTPPGETQPPQAATLTFTLTCNGPGGQASNFVTVTTLGPPPPPPPPPLPGAGNQPQGFAWSENIGWISFNCLDFSGLCATSNYAITAAAGATKVLSGYAWSENIGWVTFNAADMANSTGCGTAPNPPCNANASFDNTTGIMSGWARACSVYASGCSGAVRSNLFRGDWEGWISLRGTTYGILANGKKWTGYAWGGGGPAVGPQVAGSENIGWIQFRGFTNPAQLRDIATFGVTVQDDAAGTRTISCGVDKSVAAVNEEVIWSVYVDTAKVGAVTSYLWNLPTATYQAGYTNSMQITRVRYTNANPPNPKPGWVTVVAGGRPYVVDCDAVDVPGLGTEPLPNWYPNVLIGNWDLQPGTTGTSVSGTLEVDQTITISGSTRLTAGSGSLVGISYVNYFEIDNCFPAACDGVRDSFVTSVPISDHVNGDLNKLTSALWVPTQAGNYKVRIRADGPDDISETNETNNYPATWIDVTIAPKPVTPITQGAANCRPSPSLTQVDRFVTWSVTNGPITGGGSPPLHYHWDFSDGNGTPQFVEGDGMTSAQSLYSTPGSKRAVLTVTSPSDPGLTPLVIECAVVARVQTFTEF